MHMLECQDVRVILYYNRWGRFRRDRGERACHVTVEQSGACREVASGVRNKLADLLCLTPVSSCPRGRIDPLAERPLTWVKEAYAVRPRRLIRVAENNVLRCRLPACP